MESILDTVEEVKAAGFECAIAIATEAEVQAGAACGQMSIINDDEPRLVDLNK